MTLASRAFPEWVEPMAATLTQERFSGPEWIFERKLDGIRLLAFKNGPAVNLFSRNRLPQDIPAVADAMASLPASDVILDGEITWGRGGLAYHVFDIMWLDGRDVMSLPLDERRALLGQLPLQPPFERVISLDDPKPWERACSEGWEGVIAKRRTSQYEHRRSPHWLKMKCEAAQELVVGGFTDPQGIRVGLGALLVGYFESDRGLRPRGPSFAFARGDPVAPLRRARPWRAWETSLRREGRYRFRYEAAAGSTRSAGCARDSGAAVHEGSQAATRARSLGASRDRRQSCLH